MSRDTAVVAGALALRPGVGGHTWVFLQYLLGLRRLGWDVLFLDQIDARSCVDAHGMPCAFDRSENARYFLEVMERFDLGERCSLGCGGQRIGVPRNAVLDAVGASPLFLNVMGYLDDPDVLVRASRRVFLDIDPGFGQMWQALGQADIFRGHDAFVTIAENIGKPECTIPTCGLDWVTTPQPVVLEHWPVVRAKGAPAFTSVGAWRGLYDPVEFDGRRYGLRVHEFRKLFALPRASGQAFELALDIHSADGADRDALFDAGWSLVDPARAAGDPSRYQAFVQGSWAELMVAKNMYVQTRSGWMSDRSLCYLASGKPVLAQDTGVRPLYPVGEGLVVFDTLEEAVSGAVGIMGNYEQHARAARAMAEEHFDSDIVLSKLLGRLGAA